MLKATYRLWEIDKCSASGGRFMGNWLAPTHPGSEAMLRAKRPLLTRTLALNHKIGKYSTPLTQAQAGSAILLTKKGGWSASLSEWLYKVTRGFGRRFRPRTGRVHVPQLVPAPAIRPRGQTPQRHHRRPSIPGRPGQANYGQPLAQPEPIRQLRARPITQPRPFRLACSRGREYSRDNHDNNGTCDLAFSSVEGVKSSVDE